MKGEFYLIFFIIKIQTVILFRIKKGCLLEVEVTTVIMAKVLTDILPTSYVLMRVVGEFLSPNQLHPTSMCTVVNQVFLDCDQSEERTRTFYNVFFFFYTRFWVVPLDQVSHSSIFRLKMASN